MPTLFQTVSSPLKEGHHFDQNLGGIAGLFESIRSNTQVRTIIVRQLSSLIVLQGIANSHLETEKNLKGSVLPILERLHSEIKNKNKELTKGAAKGSKEVDKARNITQKHIELLGQHSGAFASSGGKIEASNDPYILQRGVNHRLNHQVLEENNNRHDLLAVQDSFMQFEAHVIQTIQQAMSAFLQCVSGQSERQKAMYSDIISTAQHIPPDFEFKGFVHRNSNTLIDPSMPKRTVSNISYPNQNHASTRPLIAGALERKSRAALKGYSASYYVVTPAKYLHEFKDDDDFKKDPIPELSLYLPDCIIGGVDGERFNIKGKDASKGKVGSALAMSHEMAFRAKSPADAEKWWTTIREAAGQGSVGGSMPSSPIEKRNVSGQQVPPEYQETKQPRYEDPKQHTPTHSQQPGQIQTQGLPQQGTGYQGASITPGAGTVSGYDQMNREVQSAGTGYSPASGAPRSGVERAPGQY